MAQPRLVTVGRVAAIKLAQQAGPGELSAQTLRDLVRLGEDTGENPVIDVP